MSADGQLSKEDFEKMLEEIYKYGGNPEYVVGKCPHCRAPFEYAAGHLIQGHYASECPHAPKSST